MNWKKWLGIGGLVALIAFVVYAISSNNTVDEESFVVRTSTIQTQDVSESVSTQGLIQPVDTQKVIGQGLVVEVNVELGDQVSQGDVLAEYAEMGEITADFDGTITELNIQAETPDINAQLGQPSLKVESLNNLEVAVELSQNDAENVELDQEATLSYQSQDLQGAVSYIAPTASQEGTTSSPVAGGSGNQVLETIISFNEEANTDDLVAGFNIDVSIQTNSSENALVVPVEALNFDDDGKPYVFKTDGQTAQQIMIETGLQSDLVIEVTEGDLAEGDQVILSPDEDLKDGDSVTTESEEG